jgi:hypothetical protein
MSDYQDIKEYLKGIIDSVDLILMSQSDHQQQNPYEILGITPSASAEEIIDAYESKLDACDELASEMEENGLTDADIKELRGLLISAFKALTDSVIKTKETTNKLSTSASEPAANTQKRKTTVTNINIADLKREAVTKQSHNVNKSRSRSFEEFPGIPNLVSPAEKSGKPAPVARLRDTATLHADSVTEIRDEVNNNSSEQTAPVSQLNPPKKTAAQVFKPVSGVYNAPKIEENTRSRKITGDMPRAAINDMFAIDEAAEPRNKSELILVFCAFILPMLTLALALFFLLVE